VTGRHPSADPYFGHGSAERLEYWLDTQVVTCRYTEVQAQAMLPGYHAPDLTGCLIFALDEDTDQDTDDDAAGWGPC
jgi:hypothetical protein